MVKVGLVTAAALFRPATRPCANKVLPLPSSPLSANTEPATRSSAICRAIASVSAGLLEMNVAMGQFAICDFRFVIKGANSSQGQLWKFSPPFSLHRISAARRQGKEQFVVLPF